MSFVGFLVREVNDQGELPYSIKNLVERRHIKIVEKIINKWKKKFLYFGVNFFETFTKMFPTQKYQEK